MIGILSKLRRRELYYREFESTALHRAAHLGYIDAVRFTGEWSENGFEGKRWEVCDGEGGDGEVFRGERYDLGCI